MARSSESEEQIPLSEQFLRPLDLVSEMTASAIEVETIFQDLELRINQNDDWQKKATAIQEAISYLKGGIHNYPDANFESLASGIASSVTNLRSSLVRWGSLYIAAASQTLQTNFVSSLEIVVPALFKQLSHGTSVISNSCKYSLREVAKNVPHRRTARIFLSKLKSKASQQRLSVAEFLQIASQTWPSSILSSLHTQFNDSLKELTEDPTPAVRQIARETLEAAGNGSPSSKSASRQSSLSIRVPGTPAAPKNRISHIPTSPVGKAKTPMIKRRGMENSPMKQFRSSQMALSPSYRDRNSSNKSLQFIQTPTKSTMNFAAESDTSLRKYAKIPLPVDDAENKKDIDEYMPPKTHKTSEKFLRLLNEITSSEDFNRLNGLEMLLPPSIVSAVKFIPDIHRWQSVLPVLFRNFQDAFEEEVCDILEAFNYTKWLMNLFSQSFDVQKTVEKELEKESLTSIHLISALLLKNTEEEEEEDETKQFEVPPELQEKVLSMIQKYPNDPASQIIQEIIFNPNGNSDEDYSENLRTALETNENVDSLLDELAENIINNKLNHSNEKRIEKVIIEYFNSNKSENILKLLEFCNKIISEKETNTFNHIFTKLLRFVAGTDKEVSDLASSIMVKLATRNSTLVLWLLHKVENAINNSQDDSTLPILSVIHSFFIELPEERMNEFSDSVIQYLQPALASNNTSVRRIVVLIFVEFRYKIPDVFYPYMEQFSMTQQKLIELYSSKRGPKK